MINLNSPKLGGQVRPGLSAHSSWTNIERTIAHLKTWRALHTDYRRPLETFATTITAVLGLEFFRTVGE